MSQLLLLGDEALAQGALDAGMSGCYAYPGTPSTEIMEYVQRSSEASERGVHRQWSCNEKVAMEEALGMSFAGQRAMVCMKHVGLNVAADGFINAAITGSHGGLLVVAADDPSMHSSQNEQDSRFYAQFAMIPCLEPSDQQEAYVMAAHGFALSEQLEVPILVRLCTRLSHSRANVSLNPVKQPPLPLNPLPAERGRFILLPAIAKQNYARLCARQDDFLRLSEESPFNHYYPGTDRRFGVLAAGIAYNYLQEAFGGACPYPVLKISQYPLPPSLLSRLLDDCEQVMVLEDGMPMIEQQLRGPLGGGTRFRGRLSGDLPRAGELNPRLVAQAFGLPVPELSEVSELVKMRPPRLCDGCPHANSFDALNEVMRQRPDGRVFGDIGCYTLGALPPYEAIHACVDMGASISMAKGAADAGVRPAVAVIGDSTFTHSGMTALLDAVWENSPITVVILDNGTTGMTGGQDSLAAGRMEEICAGIGVPAEQIHVLTPLPKFHADNVAALTAAVEHQGVTVVVLRRECIQTLRRKK